MREPGRATPQRAPSRGRLTRSAEFERVYKQGRSTANRHLVVYTFANPAAAAPRLGLSISRRVGGAVERNRVKRTLRESFANVSGDIRDGQDVVIVARPAALELLEREGSSALEGSLRELLGKAGFGSHPSERATDESGEPASSAADGRAVP